LSSSHFMLYLIVSPPTPKSTLFPYTTLFRSATADNLRMLCLLTYADMKAVNNEVVTPWKEDLLWQLYVETYNRQRRSSFQGVTTDRKSTRLNFSHVAISYAVFCLKKKRK